MPVTDWIITVPMLRIPVWELYEKELARAAAGEVLNYRLKHDPKVEPGDRIFVVWNGLVRGWMTALGVVFRKTAFRCTTTGNFWPGGWYVQRTGEFHEVPHITMRGFRGIRRTELFKDTP